MNSAIPEAARVGLEVELRDRLDRLDALTAPQRAEVLSSLAALDGAVFDAIIDDITGSGSSAAPDDGSPAETYCLLCGGPLVPHAADHEPFLGWRPRESR